MPLGSAPQSIIGTKQYSSETVGLLCYMFTIYVADFADRNQMNDTVKWLVTTVSDHC